MPTEELSANEIARRLAQNDGMLGPKFTVTLEPRVYEDNPRYVKWLMAQIRLISSMLELFFSIQGLTCVTLKWENLHMVKKTERIKPE